MKVRWERIKSIYDEVQHDPVSMPPDLEGLSEEDASQEMQHWFFTNFEDPAESTPYESREGGYIYIWGGPYESRDVIEAAFTDFASDDLIDEVVSELDNQSPYWVPSSSRRQPPDDDEPPEEELSREEAYTELQKRVGELQRMLERVPEVPVGIGHNKPPETIDDVPFDHTDKVEISEALIVIQAQPLDPPDEGKAAKAAVDQLETKRQKLSAWIFKMGALFTEEAVKTAGKEVGTWGTRAFFVWLLDTLLGITDLARTWLSHIPLPF